MNTKNKSLRRVMLTTALALMTASAAHADPNPANDSGSFTVRITPNVDLGVSVDTAGSAWEGSASLDTTMDLGTVKRFDVPVAIAMAGNFNNQELTLTGVALNTWTLDTDEADGVDQLRLYAMFGTNAYAASPAVGDFAGVVNLIKTTPTRAGQVEADEGSDNNHVYELPTAHGEYGEVDALTPADARSLWLRMNTPSTTSTDQQSAFTVVVTAVTGTGL